MERRLLLLGLLRQEEMHGYQLHEFIERYMQTCVDLKKSTAYYLLDKMEDKGWITSSEEQEGNRPRRQVYRLTAAGEEQFQQLLRENLAGYWPARFAGDVGISFLDALPAEEALPLLQQRRAALAAALTAAQDAPPHAGTLQLLLEHQVAHLEAELSWLDRLLDRLAV
jgi:DNA-binding PadR family transcriptional regulator